MPQKPLTLSMPAGHRISERYFKNPHNCLYASALQKPLRFHIQGTQGCSCSRLPQSPDNIEDGIFMAFRIEFLRAPGRFSRRNSPLRKSRMIFVNEKKIFTPSPAGLLLTDRIIYVNMRNAKNWTKKPIFLY